MRVLFDMSDPSVAAAAITFFASGEGAIVAGPKNGGPSMSTGDEPGIATRSEAERYSAASADGRR